MRRYGEPVDPRQTYREPARRLCGDPRGRRRARHRAGGAATASSSFPAAASTPGEGALRALHRECLEEIGWRIRVVRRLGAFQRFTYMPEYDLWARKVCHVYLARPVRRVGEPAEPGHSAVWMPIPAALELLAVDGDRAFLERVWRFGG